MLPKLEAGLSLDRYTLVERLGSGGQGEVWKARDRLAPHELVAIKLAPIEGVLLSSPERMRREAHSLARLEHPGLVRCRGLFEDLHHGLLGVVMDLVDGEPLEAQVAGPRLSRWHREAVLWHVVQVLAYLHQSGVIYRDLKPENILLGSRFWAEPYAPGALKVIDLGIAVSVGNPSPLTHPLSVVGTPACIAPELLDPGAWAERSQPTPAVDIFAFGVLGWLLLAGAHPTGLSPSSTHVDFALAYRKAASPGASWPVVELDHPWAPTLRACLRLSPADRTITAAEVARRLGAPLAEPLPESTAPLSTEQSPPPSLPFERPPAPFALPPLPSAPATSTAPSAPPSLTPEATPERRFTLPPPPRLPRLDDGPPMHRWPKAAAPLLAALAALLTLALLALPRRRESEAPPAFPAETPASSSLVVAPPPPPTVALPPSPAVAPPVVTTAAPAASGPVPWTILPAGPGADAPGPAPAPAPAEAERCACDTAKSMRPCASQRAEVPLSCDTTIPSGSTYFLRLSHVAVRSEGGKVVDLADLSPAATVRFCLAGTQTCARATVAEARAPLCAAQSRLRVSIADLTARGIDIFVDDPARGEIGAARAARHAALTPQALCKGMLFGRASWAPGVVERAGFFLDEP